MGFYDYDPMSLPKDAQYYFNILIIQVQVPLDKAEEVFGSPDITSYWNIEGVNEPRPYAVCFYTEEELFEEEDDEFYEDIEIASLYLYPHCVIEVDPNLGVSWYNMFDEDYGDLWRR